MHLHRLVPFIKKDGLAHVSHHSGKTGEDSCEILLVQAHILAILLENRVPALELYQKAVAVKTKLKTYKTWVNQCNLAVGGSESSSPNPMQWGINEVNCLLAVAYFTILIARVRWVQSEWPSGSSSDPYGVVDNKPIRYEQTWPQVYAIPFLNNHTKFYALDSIKEILRVSYGVSLRMTRLYPKGLPMKEGFPIQFRLPDVMFLPQQEELSLPVIEHPIQAWPQDLPITHNPARFRHGVAPQPWVIPQYYLRHDSEWPAWGQWTSIFDVSKKVVDVPSFIPMGILIHDDASAVTGGEAYVLEPTKGSVVHLHTDPFNSFICQLEGRQYIRVYSKPCIFQYLHGKPYPSYEKYAAENGYLSTIPVELVEGPVHQAEEEEAKEIPKWEQWGQQHTMQQFYQEKYEEYLLQPGDAVFIPQHWFWYSRSIEKGVAVQFTWGEHLDLRDESDEDGPSEHEPRDESALPYPPSVGRRILATQRNPDPNEELIGLANMVLE